MKYFYVVMVLGLLTACGKMQENNTTITKKIREGKYYNPKEEVAKFDTLPTVEVRFKDSIKNWKGYYRVQEQLENLKLTTPNEALSESDILVKNITNMRDSLVIKTLNIKGIKARVNALYNQALRLEEMKNIPAITADEINDQTEGLFVIFNTINKRINAVYERLIFERELLEDNFMFSKMDSIR